MKKAMDFSTFDYKKYKGEKNEELSGGLGENF